MYYTQGGKQSIFFNFINSLSLWIGIFLLAIFLYTTPVLASEITPYNILELTNAERARFNLSELKQNELLTKAAQQKATDIIEQQKFSHNLNDKKFSSWAKDAGYEYSIIGENLGINFDNTESLFNAWLASPTHKKNIVHNNYSEIGIAIKQGEWHGKQTYIVVQMFGAPLATVEPVVLSSFEEKNITNTSPILTSNLAENYLTNITTPQYIFKNNLPEKINFQYSSSKNKTAIANHFLMAAQLMLIFIIIMLLLILIHQYLTYFISWSKKLQLLNKPNQNYYS